MTDTDFPTNAEKLPWPQDLGGITSRLKREGCRSIGRINGNDKHYATVMEVLRVLAKHAKVKIVAQKKRNDDLKLADIARRERSAATKAGDRVLKLRNIEKDMEHLKKQHAALSDQSKLIPAPVHTVANIMAPLPPTAPLSPVIPTVEPKTRTLQTASAKAAGLGLPKAG